MDEELAKRIVDIEMIRQATGLDESPEIDALPKVSSSAGFSHEVYLLMMLCDYMQQLNATLIAVNLPKGKKPPKFRPVPRPVSAVDRERAKREKEVVEDTLAELGF
ncbi:hypothetical protein [Nocardia brasiliensis]|uniref:hypothetical protein n=1 Tax=Nocardia brasiliensis TaxID=37326 RepID=UPI0024538231|nr:hypothetical protein [Nocardia brasiliensis]